MLLIFRRAAAKETVTMPGGTIPGHDGAGPLHIAFAIGKDELARWEQHLALRGVAIEGATSWSRGGRSVYFRDPDGHLLELATRGCGPCINSSITAMGAYEVSFTTCGLKGLVP